MIDPIVLMIPSTGNTIPSAGNRRRDRRIGSSNLRRGGLQLLIKEIGEPVRVIGPERHHAQVVQRNCSVVISRTAERLE